jgi:hypothetical protein
VPSSNLVRDGTQHDLDLTGLSVGERVRFLAAGWDQRVRAPDSDQRGRTVRSHVAKLHHEIELFPFLELDE